MVTKAHPETDVRHVEVLRQRVQLIVTGHVAGALTYDRQVVGTLDLEHLVLHPLAVLPAPYPTGELTEVDLRVEVGGEVVSVVTGVDVDDIDIADAVEMLHAQRRVGVDHTRVEAHAEDGGDLVLFTQLATLPFVVGIPRRCLADLVRVFMDGGVEVGGAGLDTGLQDRHVNERRSDVDDQLRLCLANQRLGRFDIQRVQGMGLQFTGSLQTAFFPHAVDDLLTLLDSTRGDVDVTQHVIVLRTLVRNHLGNPSGTNNQYVSFHYVYSIRLLGLGFGPQERPLSKSS